ncbi:unnamed protein product [Agarophyton chilense]
MAFAQTLLRKMRPDSLSDNQYYDVFFVVRSRHRDGTPSETRLGAHRAVLSALSETFDSTCTSVPDQPHSEILVTECSAAAVREALEIIYGGEMSESQNSIVLALEVWHFGVIFDVEHLIQLARSTCLEKLSTDNCLRILDFAVTVDDQNVVEQLQNYTADTANFSHVIASPYFNRLSFAIISALPRPGKGECAWPEILTFEKVWFDALIKWLETRLKPAEQDSNPDADNLPIIRKVLDLVDFSRMKTHELREVAANPIAVNCPSFSPGLVSVLLTRSEQLEATILERNIDLDVIGQKYQQALCEADEAERKSRGAAEKLEKVQAAKHSLERRFDDIRRKKSPSSRTPPLNSARRKPQSIMRTSSTLFQKFRHRMTSKGEQTA